MTVSTIDKIIQDKDCSKRSTPVHFEEALVLTGYGKYNYGLISVCSFTLLAMGLDVYGMSFIVPAAACDLNLTVSQRGILSAIPFIGTIVSCHTWGYFSDTRGRRYIMIKAMWIGFVLAFLSGFSPNWIVLAVLKFFVSAFTSAANSAVYTLLGESSPAHARNRALLIMASSLTCAQSVVALIAWPLIPLPFAPLINFLGITYRPWRLLVQLMASTCAISALSLQFFHESPKFLASQGRKDEALAVLKKMYAANTGDEAENYPVREFCFNEDQVPKKSSVLRSLWEQTVPLFKRPLLVNTLKIYHVAIVAYGTVSAFAMWFPTIVNSYLQAEAAGTAAGNNLCGTFSIEGVSTSPSNSTIVEVACEDQIHDITVYVVLVLAIVSLILSIVIANLVRWTGKKSIVILILVVSGTSGIICNLVYNPTLGLILLLIFLLEGLVLGLITSFCVDVYPTKFRGMAVCLAIMIGRTSGFVSINVVGLMLDANCESAFYVFGALSLSGIISAFLLPSESALQKSNSENGS